MREADFEMTSNIGNRLYYDDSYLTEFQANLVEQFYESLAKAGSSHTVPVSDYRKQAEICLKWHDKSNYVKLVQNNAPGQLLPDHVPTAIISSGQLRGMKWQ